jgi:2'-5' RNA ligase
MNSLSRSDGDTPASRLFFALWPDDETRRRLAAVQQALAPRLAGLRWIPPGRLHLTLHFLGCMPPERLARSRQLARELRGEGFRLELDRLGCFERARVLWLGPSRQPQALEMLQANLGERLAEVGYRAGFDRYRPHVTLARKLRSLPGGLTLPDGALPVAWPVDAFVLIESVDTPAGVDYRVLERYPL